MTAAANFAAGPGDCDHVMSARAVATERVL